MYSKNIAYGGILIAISVVFLYAASVMLHIAFFASVCAGIISTVPMLAKKKVRAAFLIYLAVSVLAFLLLPRKGIAILYSAFFGMYPIIKYGIESKMPRKTQLICKLVYFNIALITILLVIKYIAALGIPAIMSYVSVCFIVSNIIFILYDLGVSHIAAMLRGMMPPE